MESFERRLENKLQTNEGQPTYPFFGGVPGLKSLSVYQISHLYNYLVGKDDHSVENLRTFKTCKRLFGCKFFHDGHVEDLQKQSVFVRDHKSSNLVSVLITQTSIGFRFHNLFYPA